MCVCVCVHVRARGRQVALMGLPDSVCTLFAYTCRQPSVLIASEMSLLGSEPRVSARRTAPMLCQC